MKAPSDIKILSKIYKLYYEEYKNFSTEVENGRKTKIFVPIDCQMIADELDTDGDIIFGRLYYHMEQKYGYRRDDDSRVAFFLLQAGNDQKCVNFPLLASVLAGMQEEDSKFKISTWLSTIAIVVAVGTAVAQVIQS
ncbi:hypothetical protein [Metapseudomonas resinovorans]|uniref:Uncharacterized protein n=1 Tax=Metapseudomonas resinovorans NBRC 106553 TaxID=1245471 RepID=S6AHE4_METRE|nr:hypothetical protein [Pseudomonas resinovorans]BAN47675.1 hypothetical protein PCA10_19430 [Pseudomonas resinovorans NBRC 106553]